MLKLVAGIHIDWLFVSWETILINALKVVLSRKILPRVLQGTCWTDHEVYMMKQFVSLYESSIS